MEFPPPTPEQSQSMWKPTTHSQRVAAAALLGVYGEGPSRDEDLVRRGLNNELSDNEIEDLEKLRPEGQIYRYGPGGRFSFIK